MAKKVKQPKKAVKRRKNMSKSSEEIHNKLKAVINVTRFQIMTLLMKNKKGVHTSEIKKELNIEPTLLSHHIAILREAGMVSSERQGKSVFNTINTENVVRNAITIGDCTVRWKV